MRFWRMFARHHSINDQHSNNINAIDYYFRWLRAFVRRHL